MVEILDDAIDQHPMLSFVWNSILLFIVNSTLYSILYSK